MNRPVRYMESWKALTLQTLNHWLYVSPLRNQWLTQHPIEIYVRKGGGAINGRFYNHVVTLANVSVGEKSRRKGYFRFVMGWMESLLEEQNVEVPVDAIYLENCITPRMIRIAARHGWERDRSPHLLEGGPPCFYKTRAGAGAELPFAKP